MNYIIIKIVKLILDCTKKKDLSPLFYYSLTRNQLLKLVGMPRIISNANGKHQLADLSTNSTMDSPDIGLLKAVINAHKIAHPTTTRIG